MSSRTARLVILLTLALGTVLPAQIFSGCPTVPLDDGFSVGCCNPPNPTLPAPPPVTMQASWGVYDTCALSFNTTGVVKLGSPAYGLCDVAQIPITLKLPGSPVTKSVLIAKYARTWTEATTAGTSIQVWRFLVNCDMPFTPTVGCPAPGCVPAVTAAPYNLPAHFVGHIDYACENGLPGFVAAISLNHLPGCVMHGSLSTVSIPALAASQRSYHLVGPAPFLFGPVAEPQGTVTNGAVRASTLFFPPAPLYLCHGEADLFGGALTTANSDCLCSPLVNGPWRHQNLVIDVCCFGLPSIIQSQPVPGTPFAATGLAAFTLGTWSGSAVFPTSRNLVVYMGQVNNAFTCSPVLSPNQWVTGVATTTPFPSAQPFPSLASSAGCPVIAPGPTATFLDLQNMLPLVLASAGSLPTPGFGSLFIPDLVVSVEFP